MQRIAIAVASILGFLAIANSLPLPFAFRFENPEVSYLFVIGLCVLWPFSIFVVALTQKTKDHMIAVGIAAGAIAVPCSLVYFFAKANYEMLVELGYDASFRPVAALEYKGAKYKLYRTNGGATTAFGLELREERELLLSLHVVQTLHIEYPASKGRLSVKEDGKLLLQVESNDGDGTVRKFKFDIES